MSSVYSIDAFSCLTFLITFSTAVSYKLSLDTSKFQIEMAVIKFQFLTILQRLCLAVPPITPSREDLIREEYLRLTSFFPSEADLFSVNVDIGRKFKNENFDVNKKEHLEVEFEFIVVLIH